MAGFNVDLLIQASYLVTATVQVTADALANRTFPDQAAAGDTEAEGS